MSLLRHLLTIQHGGGNAVCIPGPWSSDFEDDTVGEIPAGWTELTGTFRARDDQAEAGNQSARIDGASSLGFRDLLCQPTEVTIDAYIRVQGAAETRIYWLVAGSPGFTGALAPILGRSHFRYFDGTWKDVPNSPSPAANTWYHVIGYFRAVDDKRKYVINGNDSGWLNFVSGIDYFRRIHLRSASTYYPTYAWIDEVAYTPSIP